MKTSKSRIVPILVSLAAFLPGCGGSADAGGQQMTSVAIIDLDEVAKRTGLTNQMSGSMKQAEDQLNAQLKQIQSQFQGLLDQKKKELEGATEEAKPKINEELANLNRQLNQKMAASRTEAQQKLSMHTQGLIGNVREILRPKVTEIAKEAGFQIVLTANKDVIFSFEPSVDITQKVVDRLLKEAAEKNPTGAPPAAAASPAASAPAAAASPAAPASPAPASPSPAGP